MRLKEYFSKENAQEALRCYATVAAKRNWQITHKLDLYNRAKIAFEIPGQEPLKKKAFRLIYDDLRSYWKIFRNTAGTPLPSDQVFDLLVHECAPVSRESGTTLVNIETPVYHRTILTCIKKLDCIKPVKSGFSHMAVAKFTHFFNPRLFPIYDNDVVWRRLLCGVFSEDYRQFCRIHNMRASENGPEFNVNYIRLAGECLRENSKEVMGIFGKWFRKETENYTDPTDVRNDMETYFATAFELVAIGAAALEGENF